MPVKPSVLAGRKVLITGATGFLGSHLCGRLSESGAEVHAASRSQRSAEVESSVRWWQVDMTDVSAVRHLLTTVEPSIIYHLSGLSVAAPDCELVLPIFHSLLGSTVNVLTAATEIGKPRVVLAASLTEPEGGRKEPTPGSPYAAAKWAAGGYARMFHRLYQLPVVLVRPFQTYGPGQDERKLIPYMILSLLRGEAPKLSSGNQQFDWIYIDDVVDGLIAGGETANVEGSTIDLGSGIPVSVHDIADRLLRLVGAQATPVFGARADRPVEWARVADVQDAHAKLGWRPTVPLEAGLKKTVEWYRRHVSASSRSTETATSRLTAQ